MGTSLNPPASLPDVFLSSDVARILAIPQRRLEGWVEQGFITPARPSGGRGRSNIFTRRNLLEGLLLIELQGVFGERSPIAPAVLKETRAIAGGTLTDYANAPPTSGTRILTIPLRRGELGRVTIMRQTDLRFSSMAEGWTLTLLGLGILSRRLADLLEQDRSRARKRKNRA